MLFTFGDIMLLSFVLAFVISIAFIVFVKIKTKSFSMEDLKVDALVSAIITFVLFFALDVITRALLPTYYVVDGADKEKCEDKYALNSDFFYQIGKRYVYNRTSQTFMLVCVAYGDAELEDDEIITSIKPGLTQVTAKDIEFFRTISEYTTTKGSKGKIVWYLMTEELYQQSYEESSEYKMREHMREYIDNIVTDSIRMK